MSANNCQLRNSNYSGSGIFALKPFKAGEVVLICQIQASNVENSVHASQVDLDKWVLFTLEGRTVNHSCDPNSGVGFDGANWNFMAIRDIDVGEEITYDYAMGNYVIENFPQCFCGSPKCRRFVSGFKDLPIERKKEYKKFVAPYLQKLLDECTQ